MILAERLRTLREEQQLSRMDVEILAGLPQGCLSRVERGLLVPTIETLDELASVLHVPLSRLFYSSQHSLVFPNLPDRLTADDIVFGSKCPDEKTAVVIPIRKRREHF